MDLANNILDAIDILADNSVSAVKFDKTVRASIYEVVDESIGKYKVKYQNSIFYAYSLDIKKKYAKGTNVFVVIPASDFNKDPYITGTTKKLASSQNEVLTWEDRLSPVGSNVVESTIDRVGFCSYESNDRDTNTIELYNALTLPPITRVGVDANSTRMYKADSEYMLVGATVQTALDAKQRVGGGDYGIKITCRYWNPKYKDYASAMESSDSWVLKDYILCVDNMSGQPYSYSAPSNQYAVFEIDAEHFDSIVEIKAFCKNFPASGGGKRKDGELKEDGQFYDENGRLIPPAKSIYMYDKNTEAWYVWNGTEYINQSDIFISNIRCEFYDALSDEELQGLSLRITTPYGGFFYTDGGLIKPASLRLHADVRVQGKKVNYQQQKVNFYWFVKDNRVTTNSSFYHPLAGAGWRCLNSSYQIPGGGTGFNAETSNKDVTVELCKAYETNFKCIAVFMLDNITESISGIKTIYNKTKETDGNVYIVSSMGNDFKFDLGKTTLTCYIDNNAASPQGKIYEYWWSSAIDGGIEEIDSSGTIVDEETGETIPDPDNLEEFYEHHSSVREVEITGVPNFITYNCTIYDKTDDNDNYIGSASITLRNGQDIGQFSLVLHNGVRVFKYNADGVSPASPSLDEFNRIAIPALGFDIYNEQGQLVGMTDEEKPRMCTEITWFWPGTEQPSVNSTESMLIPTENIIFKKVKQLNPNINDFEEKWAATNQANLPYGIANMYDIDKTENTISLQVIYKGQILHASTNFTFTKDGEQGSNGTQFITRIVPITGKRVVIKNKRLQRENDDGSYTDITDTAPFKVEIWDGGTVPYLSYYPNQPRPSNPYNNQVIWTTALADRGKDSALYITQGNKNKGVININQSAINTPQNITIKACLTTDELSENQSTYFDTYPVDVIITDGYEIKGGYREVSYKSDGTRNDYCKKPFQLFKDGVPLEENVKWITGWGTTITEAQPQILPPINYVSENIDTWIAAYEDDVLRAYVPIDLHLDRYGLSAMNDWDGNSLKLNQDGSNYVLAPQIGAGTRNNNGFTGITMGTAFENDKENIGLFGYHNGQRSIFLDSKTGNAEFGKDEDAKIVLGPTARGKAPRGAIYSGSFYEYDDNHEPFKEAGEGMLINLIKPEIRFGSGHFSVDSSGNITAVDGGTIANWIIGTNTLTSQDGNVYLNSAATDGAIMLKAGSHFTVAADGTINASQGKIAGWDINDSEIFHKNSSNNITMFMHKNGIIGGGSGGSYSGGGHSDLKWVINSAGVGYFSDVFINNDSRGEDTATIIKIGNKSGQSGGGTFTVNNKGEVTASKADIKGTIQADKLTANTEGKIAGWTITPSALTAPDGFSISSGGTVTLGAGFTANKNTVNSDGSHTGSHSGSHSGTGSGFSLGSGVGNSLAGVGLEGNTTGHWFDMEYTKFTSVPSAAWSASDYSITIPTGDSKGTYTLQGPSFRPFDGFQFYPYKLTVLADGAVTSN